jgi:hypothetical protein
MMISEMRRYLGRNSKIEEVGWIDDVGSGCVMDVDWSRKGRIGEVDIGNWWLG